MKHAILISAHKDIDQLYLLIEYFKTDCYVFIHLDKKNKYSEKEIEQLEKLPSVIRVYRKYNVYWGGFNVLKSELYLFKQALEHCDADYFHLISGQDYPIKPFEQFLNHFQKNKGTEYIEYMELPSPNWKNNYDRFQHFFFYDKIDFRSPNGAEKIRKLIRLQKRLGIKRSIPDQFDRLYGGSAWLSLTRECVSYLIKKSRKHTSFFRRLKYTFAPEETYVPTLILNSPFRSHIQNDNYRFIRWRYENGSFPANMGISHFGDLAMSNAFFARKFEHPWREELTPLINHYMLQQVPISHSETGSWHHSTLTGYRFDASLSQALLHLCKLMEIESAVDLGCGPGFYVATLRKGGIGITGYDGNPHVEQISRLILRDDCPCEMVDLTDELFTDDPFDLVLFLNVGEYIPAQYEEKVIRNLVTNSGKYIILSWAEEEDALNGIVNSRSSDYLIKQFATHGFYQNTIARNLLREQVDTPALKNTLLVFEKQ